jgi:hypothetical protein
MRIIVAVLVLVLMLMLILRLQIQAIRLQGGLEKSHAPTEFVLDVECTNSRS